VAQEIVFISKNFAVLYTYFATFAVIFYTHTITSENFKTVIPDEEILGIWLKNSF
jgi:hypothetical protein